MVDEELGFHIWGGVHGSEHLQLEYPTLFRNATAYLRMKKAVFVVERQIGMKRVAGPDVVAQRAGHLLFRFREYQNKG